VVLLLRPLLFLAAAEIFQHESKQDLFSQAGLRDFEQHRDRGAVLSHGLNLAPGGVRRRIETGGFLAGPVQGDQFKDAVPADLLEREPQQLLRGGVVSADDSVRVRGDDRMSDGFLQRVRPRRKIVVGEEQLPVTGLFAVHERNGRGRDQDHDADQDHDIWRRVGHMSLKPLAKIVLPGQPWDPVPSIHGYQERYSANTLGGMKTAQFAGFPYRYYQFDFKHVSTEKEHELLGYSY